MSINVSKHTFLAAALLSSMRFALAQNVRYENLVLADCGIGFGENGGSTSRKMIYYPGDVWTGHDLDTYKPTMVVDVPWSGSYPWGQDGGVSATMPNGDVFSVYIDPSVKDPNRAGDAWHSYEMDKPLQCYSYHWDKLYQLDDGYWCSSAYVCNHRGTAYVKPGGGNDAKGNDAKGNDTKDTLRIHASTNSDWVELYEHTAASVLGTVRKTFNDKSFQCDNTAISLGSGCSIVWKCSGDPADDLQSIKRMAAGFGDLAKRDEFSSTREEKWEVCRRPDNRPGREGQCLQYEKKVDHFVKVPKYIQMVMDTVPPEGSGRNPSIHGEMSYEITCKSTGLECLLCNTIGTAMTVPSAGAGASILIGCALSKLC
ncbi:hypothetical protein DL766_007933 [Monosporascus sp. MC13-8B]|uniref:Ecp2 effector protein domain-containing protein n=1 Tax=Monosporascus cannonballus TaxID=155416 RepID=A0ABY0HB84_9PEZI|nr:hypothetical protein DL762_004811 [Monosporascus cannonballus]RYO93675.1 hypothetical protein DL763_004295 [Monosporascus cannonballus]RYP21460.1 hypothetical protein DL766_007933 [Monosporascus sp. MC13-8B]